jgi:hypothetical protein
MDEVDFQRYRKSNIYRPEAPENQSCLPHGGLQMQQAGFDAGM